MQGVLGPETILGYCTNVHPIQSFNEIGGMLLAHAKPVQKMLDPDRAMGVGLWFPASVARQIRAEGRAAELRDLLGASNLQPYTLNGFPFGDFHADRVKHDVYRPTWAEPSRFDYTLDLAQILAELLPEGTEGSISSLPIGWPEREPTRRQSIAERAGHHLLRIAGELAHLEGATGRSIHVDLEPEPGCWFDTAAGAVAFFEEYVWAQANRGAVEGVNEATARRFLGVCHDVCHSAVMFEPQADALATYRRAGLTVGKVQLSSAVSVDFDSGDEPGRGPETLADLRRFAEGRYLHQTMIQQDRQGVFFDDLPQAIASAETEPTLLSGTWRVHYHVPLFRKSLGWLNTTRSAVLECLHAIEPADGIRHFEVETYAWNVLPKVVWGGTLEAGIAEELRWVAEQAKSRMNA